MSGLTSLKFKRAIKLIGTPFILAAIVFAVFATREKTNLRPQANVSATSKYVRFKISDDPQESFIVRVNNPDVLEQVQKDLDSGKKLFPVGTVREGDGGFNVRLGSYWSWYIDPDSVSMRDNSLPLCDAKPGQVEKELTKWAGKTFCPSHARVEAIFDSPPLP